MHVAFPLASAQLYHSNAAQPKISSSALASFPTQLTMAIKLCACCRNLPFELFQADHDEQGITGGPEIYLPPLYDLYRRAAEGCALCKIWTANPDVRSIPEIHLQSALLRLRRSKIAPHMSVTAYIGADDIFVVYFARMPPPWSKHVNCW